MMPFEILYQKSSHTRRLFHTSDAIVKVFFQNLNIIKGKDSVKYIFWFLKISILVKLKEIITIHLIKHV